jgi:hypothetical protein
MIGEHSFHDNRKGNVQQYKTEEEVSSYIYIYITLLFVLNSIRFFCIYLFYC